jgi:hypothetical protein
MSMTADPETIRGGRSMSTKIIPDRYTISAVAPDGAPCKLKVFLEFMMDQDHPATKSIRKLIITTKDGEPLIPESKGKYRSPSGMLYTSDDPRAPDKPPGQ